MLWHRGRVQNCSSGERLSVQRGIWGFTDTAKPALPQEQAGPAPRPSSSGAFPAHQGWTQPAGPQILLYSAATTLGAVGLAEPICYILLRAWQSHAEQGCDPPPSSLLPIPPPALCPGTSCSLRTTGDTGGNPDIPSVVPGKGTSCENTVLLPPCASSSSFTAQPTQQFHSASR